ncbi:hypothetical protein GCM10028864_42000 [Microlunatus parietis]
MVDLNDEFTGPVLDQGRWLDHYFPHWTTLDRSAARYAFVPDGLRLRIDHDQPAWRVEDGPMRTSGLQTGSFAGPVGSSTGQQRHRTDGLVVRTAVPTRHLWTPSAGRVEVTAAASPDPACMLGIWLVGVEDGAPEDSGEILLAELYGSMIGPGRSTVRLGVKAHHDPRLTTDVTDHELPLDATTPHRYGTEWDETGVRILVDGHLIKTYDQVLAYPQQLMIALFEFPTAEDRDPAAYPKTADVLRVSGSGR